MDAPLPAAVSRMAEMLQARGIRSLVVGPAARELLAGRTPSDVRLLCEASPSALLELPGSVAPHRSGAVRVGNQRLALELAPADAPLEKALADATLTVGAVGWDPLAQRWLDPLRGRDDLAAHRARPGNGASRLARPLAALAAARLVAELDLEPAPELVRAMAAAAPALPGARGARLRLELDGLLAAAAPGRGLALLRDAGLEPALAPRAKPGAASLVGALPPDPVLRWTAWLRGGQASRTLARLRVPRERSRAIERRLALHPLDQLVAPRPASVGKALRRLGSREAFEGLARLRECELALSGEPAPAARARLAELRGIALELVLTETPPLAWSGRDVMRALGEPPGPRVGRALAYLVDRVIEDPSRNTPAELGAWLERWKETAAGQRG